ncbi:MAG: hypothetical protein LQ338_007996, partial [Usnochroma carphineum]
SPAIEGYKSFASEIRHHYDTAAKVVTIGVSRREDRYPTREAPKSLNTYIKEQDMA